MLAVTAHLNLWLQQLAATVIILAGARYLTRAADAISVRTGIGHSLVGVILLATATSLPELGTGISSIRLGQPDLAMGSVYGSNLFNLLLIPIIDLVWRRGPILSMCGRPARWIAWLGMGIIGIGTLNVVTRDGLASTTLVRVSPMTWFIVIFFFFAMWVLYKRTSVGDEEKEEVNDDTLTLRRAILLYLGSATTVIVGAVWLANVGDGLAKAYGWEASFVGTQFLALCTSLPEMATSLAALQIGAPALAISNLLGSNLFNMGIVVYFNDLTFTGSIWPAQPGPESSCDPVERLRLQPRRPAGDGWHQGGRPAALDLGIDERRWGVADRTPPDGGGRQSRQWYRVQSTRLDRLRVWWWK